jgi:hypothetical protein
MKKVLVSIVVGAVLFFALYYIAVYYVTFSEGYRAGELVKISRKGILFKTWEGRLSQGISDELQFEFSVEDRDKEIIEKLIDLQGEKIKVKYIERFGTFPWLGDTNYFVKEVVKTD